MKLDDNPQMVAMLDHAKGSLENKIRQAYNSGYNDGFKAGVFEAWDDMRKQLDNSLQQQFEQTEPNSSEKPNNSTISKMEQVEDEQIASKLTDVGISMVSAVKSTMEQLKSKLKDEPQTEREGE